MVHCKQMIGSLSEYLDGELDPGVCAEIERHLAACGDCRLVVDTLRRTVSLYRTHAHEALPEDARERLHVALNLDA